MLNYLNYYIGNFFIYEINFTFNFEVESKKSCRKKDKKISLICIHILNTSNSTNFIICARKHTFNKHYSL